MTRHTINSIRPNFPTSKIFLPLHRVTVACQVSKNQGIDGRMIRGRMIGCPWSVADRMGLRSEGTKTVNVPN